MPDPGNVQAYNRYLYALGNPIRYNDPSGHCYGEGMVIGVELPPSVCDMVVQEGSQLAQDVAMLVSEFGPQAAQAGQWVASNVPGISDWLLSSSNDAEQAGHSAGQSNAGNSASGDPDDPNKLAKVSEKLGQLKSVGQNVWESTAGLRYGPDPKYGNRVQHVFEHLTENPNKPTHSVFNVSRSDLLPLVDEAYQNIQALGIKPLPKDPGAYVVPMGGVIGTAGETFIKLILNPGTTEVITAYPVK